VADRHTCFDKKHCALVPSPSRECVFIYLVWQVDCPELAVGFPLKVLIVDDDNAMSQMCAKLIRRHGHTAVIADSGAGAMAIVRSDADIAAVLTDIQMPHMSGIELLTQLRAFDVDLPVILMTGYTNIVSSAEARLLGAADYLSKPFDAKTLIGSLERAFRTSPSVRL
jgi:DNA-binding NtrC family response regulator